MRIKLHTQNPQVTERWVDNFSEVKTYQQPTAISIRLMTDLALEIPPDVFLIGYCNHDRFARQPLASQHADPHSSQIKRDSRNRIFKITLTTVGAWDQPNTNRNLLRLCPATSGSQALSIGQTFHLTLRHQSRKSNLSLLLGTVRGEEFCESIEHNGDLNRGQKSGHSQ